MRETGTVKSVKGSECEVAVKRKTACGENCASCSAACSEREQICLAKNEIGAKVGDKVFIEIETVAVLKSAFLVYILPLLVFFTAYAVFESFLKSEAVSAVTSILAAGTLYLCLWAYDKKRKTDCKPRVVEIISI